MSAISRITIASKRRDLKEPFRTSIRTVSHFDVVEFTVETDEGLIGCGEAVETPAITGDTMEMILADLNGPIATLLKGSSFSSALELTVGIANLSVSASAKAAADIALYNLASSIEDRTLPSLLECEESSVKTDVTVPISELGALSTLIQKRVEEGFQSYKVKLALESTDISIEKLKLIREMVGDSSAIRVDPNQAWSVDHALAFLKKVELHGISIEYLEQPTPAADRAALAQIRRDSLVPIMADESCFTMEDLLELIRIKAVDLVNIKLLKSGGITPALKMAKVARDAGIGVLIGSMMEGDGGVYAAAALAGSVAPHEVHDLDASWWATNSSLKYVKGSLELL